LLFLSNQKYLTDTNFYFFTAKETGLRAVSKKFTCKTDETIFNPRNRTTVTKYFSILKLSK